MANHLAANRYAKALFALSSEQQAEEYVHEDMMALYDLMAHSPEWKAFVLSPFGALEKRERLLDESFSSRMNPLTARFLGFINRKRRLQLFPEIYAAWLNLYDVSRGVLRARVISAVPLGDGQVDDLTRRLGKRFGKEVILSVEVDADLIGGLKIFIGDHVFDYSIESQLQDLQKDMLHA